MKCDAKTEQEMRDAKAPSPATTEGLAEYITSLTEREHDYGTCVYAMSLAAVAAFNFVASKLGVTGYQASFASLDVLKRTRSLKGPFMIIDAEKMLYPQYNLQQQLREAMDTWREWASNEAKKKLAENGQDAHPDVVRHWNQLAS